MPLPMYEPRYQEEIFLDMIFFMLMFAPEVTDFNVGSRIRTILESASLEDDEQYHQITNLLELYNFRNNRGVNLEERLAEYNVSRFRAAKATGIVTFSNGNLTFSFLLQALAVGATFAFLRSTTAFPTSGYPYVVRLDEGTAQEEDLIVTLNSLSQGRLFFSAPATKIHARGVRVSLVQGGPLVINAGQRVRVPATSSYPERTFRTLSVAVINAGNFDSNPVAIEADVSGRAGVVAAGAIEDFVGSPPFAGALVRNDSNTTGGFESESDEAYISRATKKNQSLARATPLSLEQLVLGVSATALSGATYRVISSKIVERFSQSCNDLVFLYVWAGNFDFVEIVQVNTPEQLTSNAGDGQRYFRLANIAVVPSTLILEREIVGSGVYTSMSQGVDYFFNEGTGWVEVAGVGLNKGDKLRALRYNHYTGLIHEVQTTINGRSDLPLTYQGIRASGVKVLATHPIPKTIADIRLSFQVREGFTEADLGPLVRDTIISYLTELNGESIILAEMTERVMAIEGLYNMQWIYPTQDIIFQREEFLDLDGVQVIFG